MKTLILLFLLSFQAYSTEINISLFNIHLLGGSKYYKNTITPQGEIISNPLISIGYKHFLMIGRDSINIPIIGYYYQKNNFIVGGYSNDRYKWSKTDLKVFSIPIHKDIAILPIIGYKAYYKLDNKSSISSIITPLLINISYTIDY